MKGILLVEDNSSDEKLTVLAFKSSGVPCEITVLRDGAAAVDYLLPGGEDSRVGAARLPDLVLLDLKLPKLDGLEVLRRIRADERTRFLPVVVLTASNEDEDVRRSYEQGANAYIRKPVDFAEFAAAAETVGRFWLILNELPPMPRSSR
ncbi:MAG TPA: response regulator [Polyangiaceae bacterium]|nr:response regulator [Polyangiaceae bacterium]